MRRKGETNGGISMVGNRGSWLESGLLAKSDAKKRHKEPYWRGIN